MIGDIFVSKLVTQLKLNSHYRKMVTNKQKGIRDLGLGFVCLFYGVFSMSAWQFTYGDSSILGFIGIYINMGITFIGFFYFALDGAFKLLDNKYKKDVKRSNEGQKQ